MADARLKKMLVLADELAELLHGEPMMPAARQAILLTAGAWCFSRARRMGYSRADLRYFLVKGLAALRREQLREEGASIFDAAMADREPEEADWRGNGIVHPDD